MFDLRRRGLVGSELSMVGTSGDKFDGVREHFKKNIEGRYKEMDASFVGYPEKGVRDPEACECLQSFPNHRQAGLPLGGEARVAMPCSRIVNCRPLAAQQRSFYLI